MKLERMLFIITYLLNHEKARARELADKLEVSVRTIYRDIDAICQAGIPIVTYQGSDGGIGIIEGYKLDKSILTNDEIFNIVAGLKGLHSIQEDVKIKLLIEKLSGLANKSHYLPAGNELMIDLSPWDKNDKLALRIQEIKNAIRERKIIRFSYYAHEKLLERKVEPCVIVFKAANWYLYAYCMLREDFRLFKLRRMRDLRITDRHFSGREFSLEQVNWEGDVDDHLVSPIIAAFDRQMQYVVEDIFGIDNYEPLADGRLKVTFHMEINGWLYGFLLGFGDQVEILEPRELRDRIKGLAESICKMYHEKE